MGQAIYKTRQDNAAVVVQAGRDVLRQEADALLRCADALGDAFEQAVALILGTRGRVIVTGMGKSGHIGAKIAATLASTGTPAFFVHPGEASHGDLGMIADDDTIIAISHSGGTRELSDIVAYCNRFNLPLIAMTGKAESVLAKAATVVLLDGVQQEACPLNLAPTTSTTVSLALGDALAVACMHRRGFNPEDFARYHPGGKLGSRLSKVSDLMVTGAQMPLVNMSATMADVVLEMTTKNLGGVGIVNTQGGLEGVITDGDLKRHMSPDLLQKPAVDIMSRNPKTITADVLATAAVQKMQQSRITLLFVKNDEGKPVGYLQLHHCLQAGVI